MTSFEFNNRFGELRAAVDGWLRELGPWPGTLGAAMHYALQAGGKRFRPVLALASSEMVGGSPEQARGFAIALELVHTASLIHDDLPALDNDELRRGKPTAHVAFGEAEALLAGDALLAEAFRCLSMDAHIADRAKTRLTAALAECITTLCDGQVRDIEALKLREGSPEELTERHRRKTGSLIGLAAAGPALIFLPEREGEERYRDLKEFGEQLGLLFQITDDILDATATAAEMGKTVRSDSSRGTPTYVSVFGLEGARRLAADLRRHTEELLSAQGSSGALLSGFCRFAHERGN